MECLQTVKKLIIKNTNKKKNQNQCNNINKRNRRNQDMNYNDNSVQEKSKSNNKKQNPHHASNQNTDYYKYSYYQNSLIKRISIILQMIKIKQ